MSSGADAVIKPRQPSWWKYIGGPDQDREWATKYLSMMRQQLTIPETDREFYITAVERAINPDPGPAHRPRDALNFWLTCHFLLSTANTPERKTKVAAIDTAELAKSVGRERGHSYKKIQEHAKNLKTPASAFLAEVWAGLPGQLVYTRHWPHSSRSAQAIR